MIHFELWPEIAPIACGSVMQLAEKKIFDGRAIERLEPGFVLQPLFLMVLIHRSISWSNRNLKPILKMPKSFLNGDCCHGRRSREQFWRTSTISLFAASERLNGNFTVIGKVIDGWDEIERLEHVEVEEAIEPQSGFVYHRPVKTEMITKVRRIK